MSPVRQLGDMPGKAFPAALLLTGGVASFREVNGNRPVMVSVRYLTTKLSKSRSF
jgi:hypothetical protein